MKRAIEVAAALRGDVGEVNVILATSAVEVFGDRAPAQNDGGRHWYRSELHVERGNGSVQHSVLVEVSAADGGEGWCLRIEPIGDTHLLPSYEGTLRASIVDDGTALRLTGTYE